MTRFRNLFKSHSDDTTVSASYTPIENAKKSRRNMNKNGDRVPTAVQLRLSPVMPSIEENIQSSSTMETREDTNARVDCPQEREMRNKILTPPHPTASLKTANVPKGHSRTAQSPKSRNSTVNSTKPKNTAAHTQAIRDENVKKFKLNEEFSMHEPRLSTQIQIGEDYFQNANGTISKPRLASRSSRSITSGNNAMNSFPPFIEFSNSDILSPVGDIPTYSQRRHAGKFEENDIRSYREKALDMRNCTGPKGIKDDQCKTFEGVYNNILNGELLEDVYKNYTGALKFKASNKTDLKERYINTMCGDDGDISMNGSSFSEYSFSDSEYEESYPGFYKFVTDLFVTGIKNPIQAVNGLAEETCKSSIT